MSTCFGLHLIPLKLICYNIQRQTCRQTNQNVLVIVGISLCTHEIEEVNLTNEITPKFNFDTANRYSIKMMIIIKFMIANVSSQLLNNNELMMTVNFDFVFILHRLPLFRSHYLTLCVCSCLFIVTHNQFIDKNTRWEINIQYCWPHDVGTIRQTFISFFSLHLLAS